MRQLWLSSILIISVAPASLAQGGTVKPTLQLRQKPTLSAPRLSPALQREIFEGNTALRLDLGKDTATDTQLPLVRRVAVPFRSLAIEKNGKKIQEDAEVVLDDGRKLKLTEFRKQYDSMEKDLNAVGYSLKGPEKSVVLRKFAKPNAVLQTNAQALQATIAPGAALALAPAAKLENSTPTLEAASEFSRAQLGSPMAQFVGKGEPAGGISSRNVALHSANLANLKLQLSALDGPVSESVNIRKPFGWDLSNDLFGVYLKGEYSLSGKTSGASRLNTEFKDLDAEFHFKATASAGGHVLSKQAELLRAEATYDTNKKTDTVTLGANAYVVGQKIWGQSKTLGPNERRGSVEQKKSIRVGVGASFPIWGPFSVGCELGFAGEAGFKASYDLLGSGVSGQIVPYANTSAYAAGFVGIGGDLVQVGVQANLTLVNFSAQFGAQAGVAIKAPAGGGVSPTAPRDVVLYEKAWLHYDVTALAGNVEAYVQTPTVKVADWVPFFGGDTIVEGHRYSANLFDWDGLHTSGYLFNQSESIVIGKTSGSSVPGKNLGTIKKLN